MYDGRGAIRWTTRNYKPSVGGLGPAELPSRAGWSRARATHRLFPPVVVLALLAWTHAFALLEPAFGADSGQTSAADWIAGDAVIALQVPCPDRLLDRLTDPLIQNYLKTLPQYRKLVERKTFRDVASIIKVIATQLNTTWDQALKDLTGGGALLALEVPKGHEPHFILTVTPKNKAVLDSALASFLKLARQDATAKGKPDPVKTCDHRGVTVYSPADGAQAGLAILQGRLVVSNSSKALFALIDRASEARRPAGGAGRSTDPGAARVSLADQQEWKALRDRQSADAMAWGFARLDALRKLDPKRFGPQEKADTGQLLFFGSWIEAVKQASLVAASLTWSDHEVSATLTLPQPAGGRPAKLKGYVPGPGMGAGPLVQPPGTIAALSLWRDWATIWEARADLLSPEVVQNLAQLDTFAGQFFGGREFGTDVLAPLGPHWRLVIAGQDFKSLNPPPDVKLPAFAFVTELNAPEGDFAQRLKVAFQTFIALTNVEAAQKKAAPLELGSEDVEGVTLATARYVLPQFAGASRVTPQQRYNFSPSAAHVGKYFILSSSRSLARSLVKELKASGGKMNGAKEGHETLVVEVDGPELARLLESNRERMAMQTMLERGETKQKSQEQVDSLFTLLRYLRRGRLSIEDDPAATRLRVKIQFSQSVGAKR